MKTSNLAWRIEGEDPDTPAQMPPAPANEVLAPAERRQLRARRLGLDYRAIAIRDDGLRPLLVR